MAILLRSLIFSKQALLLLSVGILIRVPALVSPISEGYRNAQTAALTAGMVENGQLRLDPIAPWRGDLDARLVMELPIYNLAALAINALPHVPLDSAGRLASLVFWILSFLALQALWSRTLPPLAAFWANLLFIFAPMNWYLSTAFMPETLLQLLAIYFMVCALEYARKNNWVAFAGLFLTGLLGLLVKFPGFVHLGLFACLVLIDRQGWRSIFRPGLLLAAFLIAVCVFAWGEYIKAVNEAYFSDWAGWANVIGFIRPEASRLSIGYWLPLAGYNVAFIATATAIPFVVLGLWTTARRFASSFRSRVWLYLFMSLLTSWLIWGKGAPAQNYYNLPNLVFYCAAFGLGVAYFRRYLIQSGLPHRAWRWAGPALASSIVLLGLLGHIYLSRPDRVTVAVADWVTTNLPPGIPVVYQPRHSVGVVDYQHQALLSHLTGRRTWVLVRTTPDEERHQALSTGSHFVVTNPVKSQGWLEKLRNRFKGTTPDAPVSVIVDNASKMHVIHTKPEFTAAAITRRKCH